MPRALRIEYPGAIYHLMNHGDRREAICHDDADRGRSPPNRLFHATNTESTNQTELNLCHGNG